MTNTKTLYYFTEEPVLILWSFCSIDFNLCFSAIVFIIIHNALPPRTLSLCLKRLILPCPEVGHSGRYLQDNSLYFLNPSLSLTYRRIWHPDPPRWLIWNINLPCSWSAGFLDKALFLASTPCLSINWLVLWLADQTWTQQQYYIRFEI